MDVKELEGPPSLAPLYLKALATSVTGGGDELPENGLTLADVAIDPHHLAAYSEVCGFRVRDELPITYPQVLGFPIAMRLMTDGEFPLPLLGLVHIANRIVQRRSLRVSDPLTLRVRAEHLRPHAKGRQVDVVTEALADGEEAWTATATYLRRGGGSDSAGDSGKKDGEEGAPGAELRRTATWEVAGDIGRRYAGVSGDRNPIHLHWVTARLFGFPSAIAHGMWMKARCLASFEGRLPEAPVAEVSFKTPMLLPAKAAFASAAEDGGFAFGLYDARKGAPHLSGSVWSGVGARV